MKHFTAKNIIYNEYILLQATKKKKKKKKKNIIHIKVLFVLILLITQHVSINMVHSLCPILIRIGKLRILVQIDTFAEIIKKKMELFRKNMIANTFLHENFIADNDKCKYFICNINILYYSIETVINYDIVIKISQESVYTLSHKWNNDFYWNCS